MILKERIIKYHIFCCDKCSKRIIMPYDIYSIDLLGLVKCRECAKDEYTYKERKNRHNNMS